MAAGRADRWVGMLWCLTPRGGLGGDSPARSPRRAPASLAPPGCSPRPLPEAQRLARGLAATPIWRAHYVLAKVWKGGRSRDGCRRVRRPLEREPGLADAHDRLGFLLGKQGRTADAIARFQQAVALDPSLADAQYHLGATLWWTRQFEGARAALERAVRLRPGHAESRYYLGLIKRQQQDLTGAIAELRLAVKSDPRLAVAHLQLGVALQESRDLDAATPRSNVPCLSTRPLAPTQDTALGWLDAALGPNSR